MRLTEAQREFLVWLGSQPAGVVDITDERISSRLVAQGLVLKFFESDGGPLTPIWTITPAGRAALEASNADKG